MIDYRKPYAFLFGAIDDVLDELVAIPEAEHACCTLQRALLAAEEYYLRQSEEKDPGADA